MNNDEIELLAKEVLVSNPSIVEQYKGGKTTTM
jgi:Asp-tRNA(Asn)/Glu-tRNA(Gln) amidotransferase B subunit